MVIDSFLSTAWHNLGVFIGDWGLGIISGIFVLAIIRILFSAVFRLFRLHADYELRKTNWAKGHEQTWEKNVSNALDEFEEGRHIFH